MAIKTGLQNFIERGERLGGARVGLVSHPAAVLPDMRHALDGLLGAGVQVTALFGPEHGFWGFEADALKIDHSIEPRTGLPAYSLYGDHLAPTAEMLESVDLLVFDMQDVGARFYTFISTLYHLLKAAKSCSRKVIVLDRPNPLGGERVEGPLVETGYESFVGIAPLPVIHGMTTGELARWMNTHCGIHAGLEVVQMQGWQRSMSFDRTGLQWVPTSPGIPHLSTVWVYPGTCLIEGTNLSEGRGTPLPFELIGAPWLDGFVFAAALNQAGLPGVRFRPAVFKPVESKWAGQVCQGVQVHITECELFNPLRTGLQMLRYLLDECPEFSFLEKSWEGMHPHIDLLLGGNRVRSMLTAGASPAEIVADWNEIVRSFRSQRTDYLLYN